MMKQTAIDWLQEQLNPDMKTMQGHIIQDLLDQAKAMEKERIMNAWASGVLSDDNMTAEQYYNKTYKSE
jgi:hypothetical protein